MITVKQDAAHQSVLGPASIACGRAYKVVKFKNNPACVGRIVIGCVSTQLTTNAGRHIVGVDLQGGVWFVNDSADLVEVDLEVNVKEKS